ncbi:kinase inhibitor [Lithospermum erythrorhizon]|uniref:Kinase inhibitor n=1 Tax=Lithospermum erythrorhizon TaxID=34254 RepID=A0AAV3PTA1_LITER
MNSVFNEQILGDKLSKLNNTQQCIETLSHWCIFHRSKAEQVAETWEKQFQSAEKTLKVSLLYLANDILQNSKRKGNEFVTAFWKVLPSAIKEVYEKGDERGKKVASRLVDIWEQRRVFGSHAKSLKNVILGEETPGPLEFNRKRSRSIKITKRDSRSIRTKLSIGGPAEKIVSAFHLVSGDLPTEDEEMSRCKTTVHNFKKMEKDVEVALQKAKDPRRKTLSKDLEDEENILKESIQKLKVSEANRVALVSQLQEALHEQESELENVRTQIQVAQTQADEAGNLRKCLDDENYVAGCQTTKKTAATIAAEVADKLAASTSSQYIMTSVLSTFAAEEAKTAGVTKSSTTTAFPLVPANNSTIKQEKASSDVNVSVPSQPIDAQPMNNPYQLPQLNLPGVQVANNSQPQYHSVPIPTSQQFLQSVTGGMVSSYQYGSGISPFPPGPPGPYMIGSTMMPFPQQHHLQPPQQQQLIVSHQPSLALNQQQLPMHFSQQSPAPGFQPLPPTQTPGMVYYSHPHHPQ